MYFGGAMPDGVADLVFDGASLGDFFGVRVAAAGDINQDGFDDVLISAPLSNLAGSEAGCVYVYLGGPIMDAIPDGLITGEAAGDRLGHFGLAGIGDFNFREHGIFLQVG